jgi:hypothetical protein
VVSPPSFVTGRAGSKIPLVFLASAGFVLYFFSAGVTAPVPRLEVIPSPQGAIILKIRDWESAGKSSRMSLASTFYVVNT